MILQYITDNKGVVTGVYIPIEEWNNLKKDMVNNDPKPIFIPDWQKEVVFERKEIYDSKPKRTLDLSNLLDKENNNIKKCVIIPEAKKDIDAIVKLYLKKDKNSDNLFIKEFTDALLDLEKDHEKATVKSYKQIQTTTLSSYPYLIHFFVDNQNEKIVVFAVCKYVYEHYNVE